MNIVWAWYALWCSKMITRNNNVKISIMIAVGVRQSHVLYPNSWRTCPENAWDWSLIWTDFLIICQNLIAKTRHSIRAHAKRTIEFYIYFFFCNCDRYVALLFKVDGSNKKEEPIGLYVLSTDEKACSIFMKYETLGPDDSIFVTCPRDHDYNVTLFS